MNNNIQPKKRGRKCKVIQQVDNTDNNITNITTDNLNSF